VDPTRPQRKRATTEYLEKRSGEINVDSGIQVQLEEDGGGNRRQSWMETSGHLGEVVVDNVNHF